MAGVGWLARGAAGWWLLVTSGQSFALFLLPFALAQPLSAEGEEFVDEVVHRADHAGVAAVVG